MSKKSHKGGGVGSNQFGSKGSPKDRASSSANAYGRKAAMASATAANAVTVVDRPIMEREEHNIGVAHDDLRVLGQNAALDGIEAFTLAMARGADVEGAIVIATDACSNNDLGGATNKGIVATHSGLRKGHDLSELTQDEDMYAYNCAVDGIQAAAALVRETGDLDGSADAAAEACLGNEALGSTAAEQHLWREYQSQSRTNSGGWATIAVNGSANDAGFYLKEIDVSPVPDGADQTIYIVDATYGLSLIHI